MNVREGMRRLGLLLGVSGGIMGGFLGYSDAQNLCNVWTAHRKFESLMALPTTQKVAHAASVYQNGPWTQYAESTQVDYDANRGEIKGPPDRPKSKFGGVPVDDKIPSFDEWKAAADRYKAQHEAAPETVPRDFFETHGNILVSVKTGGIKGLMADKTGQVFSIEPNAGAWVDRTEAPPLKAYLVLLYPAFGFLIPWGAIRVLTWVGTGFLAEVHK
jgi:hypothetical protein